MLAIEVNKIEQDFQELKLAYQTDESLKMSLINVTTRQHFAKAGILYRHVLSNWNTSVVVSNCFSGTAHVNSNFSILKLEKDDGRTAVTIFLLEGIICTQNSTNNGASLQLLRINTTLILY